MRMNGHDVSAAYFGTAAFIAGGAVATALTVLFAMEKGWRTRERIRSFAAEAWDRTRGAASHLTQHGRHLVTETVTPLRPAFIAGRETFWREYSRRRGQGLDPSLPEGYGDQRQDQAAHR